MALKGRVFSPRELGHPSTHLKLWFSQCTTIHRGQRSLDTTRKQTNRGEKKPWLIHNTRFSPIGAPPAGTKAPLPHILFLNMQTLLTRIAIDITILAHIQSIQQSSCLLLHLDNLCRLCVLREGRKEIMRGRQINGQLNRKIYRKADE